MSYRRILKNPASASPGDYVVLPGKWTPNLQVAPEGGFWPSVWGVIECLDPGFDLVHVCQDKGEAIAWAYDRL